MKIPIRLIQVMLFETDKIPEQGLDFEVRTEKDRFAIDQNGCALDQDVWVSGTLKRIEEEFYFKGKFKTQLRLNCSLCLEDFLSPVSGEVAAHFVPDNGRTREPAEVELHASDIDVEYFSDGCVDLSRCVRDQILLEVPVVSTCREDCRGLCPECGVNRNRKTCSCANEPPGDPRMDILKTLKNRLK